MNRLLRLIAYPFTPPDTVGSVAREIVEGVESGTVIIPGLEDDSDDDRDKQGD